MKLVYVSENDNFDKLKSNLYHIGYKNLTYEVIGYGWSELTGCCSPAMYHVIFFSDKSEEDQWLIDKYLKQINGNITSDKYHFFWRGSFSQWVPSSFIVDGVVYSHAEQYMMYQKALLFDDKVIAQKILDEKHPRNQKKLGRKIKGFDESKWKENRERIVYEGNYAKFTQNKDIYNELIATKNKILVEASPVDKIWGIGMAEDDPKIEDENQWKGLNLLGKVLTKLKNDLMTNQIKEYTGD